MGAKQIAAGQQASIERGQIKEAVDAVQQLLLTKIAYSEPDEQEQRENYYFEYKALARVMARLQKVIDDGKVAVKFDKDY